MLLRASIKAAETDVDMRAVVDAEIDSGIQHGGELSAFAEALVRRSSDLDTARQRLVSEVEPEGLIQAAGTAAHFQRMTRVADAIGIPLDRDGGEAGTTFRAGLGIDRFAGAENTPAG